MEIETFIGTWDSKNLPSNHFCDDIQIRLHINKSLMATLLQIDDNDIHKTKIFAEGLISIVNGEYDNFKFIIDGYSIDVKYLELNARMYMDNYPKSIFIDIPEYGEKYFQKLE